MLGEIALNLYVVAIGFVTAGVIYSSIQLVTGRPLGFSMAHVDYGAPSILGVITRVAAGPVILLRNAIRGRQIEGRAIHWLILSSIIASTWSFFFGVLIIEGMLRLSSGA